MSVDKMCGGAGACLPVHQLTFVQHSQIMIDIDIFTHIYIQTIDQERGFPYFHSFMLGWSKFQNERDRRVLLPLELMM